MERQPHHNQPNAPSRRRPNKSKTHLQQDPLPPDSGLQAPDDPPSSRRSRISRWKKRRQKQNDHPTPTSSDPKSTDGELTIHSATVDLRASHDNSERLKNTTEPSKSPACSVLRIQGPSIPSSEAPHHRQSAREGDQEASDSHRTGPRLDSRPKKFHSRAPASANLSHQAHTPLKRSKLSQVTNANTAQTSLSSKRTTKMDPVGDSPNRSESNGSDEVVMHRGANSRGRFQRHPRGGSARLNSDSRNRAHPRTTQHIPRQNPHETPKRPAAVNHHVPQNDDGCQIKVPSSVQKIAAKVPSQEALDELKRLQEEIVLQAHLNRYRGPDDDTANPESLAKCRDGPGTDPRSDVYKSITRCRLAANPNESSSQPRSLPEDQFEGDMDDRYFVDEISSRVRNIYAARLDAQRESYNNSVSVYPAIVDGQIFLSRYPSAELQKISTCAAPLAGNQGNSHTPKHCSKVKWEDKWELRPRACSTYEGFRDRFRCWLEMETDDSCNLDIYHQAFFDGSAHMDGITSFFIPDLGDVPTRLDMSDEATRLHHHETAEGYCHNLVMHMKAAEEEARARRRQARDAFIEGLKICSPKDPNSPRANVYLRCVEDGDIPGLLTIFNWYGQKSNLSPSLGTLDEQYVRQRIEDSRRVRLPFIVAAERRRGPSADDTPEKILGYAMATDSLGIQTAGRYTVELEIYIKPDQKRRGIGKSLLDKLIEVCDATYVPKRGFFYDSGCDDKTGLYPGGARTLKRLVFTVSYSVSERSEIKWLIDWLERDYHFEQQGVLKGARVKFEHFLDVSYLVRKAGYDDGDAFQT